MTYRATLLHVSDYVRIQERDEAFSLYHGSINEVEAKGRPAKADAVLAKLGFERQQSWKNLSWGLEASVIRTSK